MSDDPSFERNARAWLELGPTDAPDRVVEAALLEIDQTSQERDLRVPWRLPIMSLATRSAAVAIVAVVALGAALVFFRPSPAGSGSPTATPGATAAPSATAASMTVAQFKFARDAICTQGVTAKTPLEVRYRKIFDKAASAAERADGIAALDAFISLSTQVTNQLAQLESPPSLVVAHAANVAQYRDIISILQHESELLHTGDLPAAEAVDITTNTVNKQISTWEAQYNFLDCP